MRLRGGLRTAHQVHRSRHIFKLKPLSWRKILCWKLSLGQSAYHAILHTHTVRGNFYEVYAFTVDIIQRGTVKNLRSTDSWRVAMETAYNRSAERYRAFA